MGGVKIMEYGFYHPKRGYWQANSDVPQHIRDGYPSGTVEVPLRPVGNFDWDGVKWVELPPDIEALSADAKAKRNTLLQRSDWTQIADVPVDQAAWASYRQALRDITTQVGFPEQINWPEAPQ
jgi:hypothetical protein